MSLVTPSFNQARFLDRALESVLSQKDELHEYFVFDGGSTDHSLELIQQHAPRITYWESGADRGQSDAIAKGFARATGDILGWINSDDVLLPGALARIRAAFASHPEWDVVTGHHVRIGPDDRIIAFHRMPAESAELASWGVTHVCQQTCFFRRSLYERVGGLNRELHCVMDTELWYRFFHAGARWGHVPLYLAAFREQPEMKGKTWLEEYRKEHELLDRRYPHFRARNLKHRLGLAYHRATQIGSGRFLRSRFDTWRLAGRTYQEVFGT